jgi:hypothetical protein
MRLTERVACAAVIAVLGSFAGSAAQADQTFTGVVTILDRTTSEVVIKQARPSVRIRRARWRNSGCARFRSRCMPASASR